jgi:hypothetical protein
MKDSRRWLRIRQPYAWPLLPCGKRRPLHSSVPGTIKGCVSTRSSLSWVPVRAISHSFQIRQAGLRAALLFVAASCLPLAAVELTDETLQAFETYVTAAEARLDKGLARKSPFLCMNEERHTKRQAIEAALRRGEVWLHRVNADRAKLPGGYLHHWMAVMFVPAADLRLAGAVSMDFDGYQRFQQPLVLDSGLIEGDGNRSRFRLRLNYHKLAMRVVLDTEHTMECHRLKGGRALARTATALVRQVARPGEESEEVMSEDDDRNEGFLWGHRSYWRFQEGKLGDVDGLFVQYESVALSHTLPMWPLGNWLKQSHREFAHDLLSNTGKAMRKVIANLISAPANVTSSCLMVTRAD